MLPQNTAHKIRKIKQDYLKIVSIAGTFSYTIESFERSGGVYPEFVLKAIKLAKQKGAEGAQ